MLYLGLPGKIKQSAAFLMSTLVVSFCLEHCGETVRSEMNSIVDNIMIH